MAEPTLEKGSYERRKKHLGQREAMLKDLSVATTIYALPVEGQVCPCCAVKLPEMRSENREELEIVPAKVNVMVEAI